MTDLREGLTLAQNARSPRPRGPVAWYGGKAPLAKWLLNVVPITPVYVEPYGGAASLLFAREPVAVEVYNDLDGRLVNLFRALQNPRRRRRLEQRLRCTFYARAEFELAVEILARERADPDDLAWAFFVAQNQAYGGLVKSASNWARTVNAVGCSRPRSWWSRVAAIDDWARRLAGVQIEQRDAIALIRSYDSADTTFYLDPPYVHATRDESSRDTYAVELTDEHHEQLVDALLDAEGACVLSGYPTPIYGRLERAGWEALPREVPCTWRDGHGRRQDRVEVVWRNARARRF